MVTTLAGSSWQQGSADGTGSAARFRDPSFLVVDKTPNVYVSDSKNATIRKITPGGVVTTLAGNAGRSGSADGTGSAARFALPEGIAVDGVGNVYVADEFNHTIRRITPGGVVTTLAGSPGLQGRVDGAGNAVRFHLPSGVAVDSAGNLYVADSGNNRITKGTPLLQFDTSARSPVFTNGLLQMRLLGPSGSNVVVEASANLQTWTPVQTNLLLPFGLDVSVSVRAQNEFFRARLAP